MRGVVRIGSWLLGGAVALGLGAAPPAQAADYIYLELTCQNQGLIRGDSTQSGLGRDAKIEVHELHHLIHENPATGMLTHEPLIFTKRVDRSTVNLYSALATAERCSAVFRYYRADPSGTGTTEQYYKVTLSNARFVAIEPITADILNPASAVLPDRERLRMVYGTITFEYPSDGGEAVTLTAN